MKTNKQKMLHILVLCILSIVVLFLAFDIYILYLHFSGNDNEIKQIVAQIDNFVGYLR